MNLATKAALFNALLFPGWGQIYLKRYRKGIAIIIAVVAGTLSILWSIIQIAITLLKISPFKKGTVSFDAVVKFAFNSIKELNMSYLFSLLLFMILLWIFSIIDAYFLGKKEMAKITIAADQQSTFPEN
jgi:TM2 domain-containing membrane protein YozV